MLPLPCPARRARAARQLGEDRRRVALARRRLAGRQADLALRHGEARDAVHQAQHVLAVVAEVFGDGERQVGRLAAHQRRLVGGGDDHDAAREALGAEIVGEEFLHLAAALADQADHGHVGGGVARHHRQQRRLADARAGEDAHALAAAAGEEGIDGAHAEIDLAPDALARMRGRRRGAQQERLAARRQRALAVDRLAQRVDDAAEPGRMRPNDRLGVGDLGLAAEADAVERAERHQRRAVVAEADDLARHAAAVARDDGAAAADRKQMFDAADLDQHALHGSDAPVEAIRRNADQVGDQKGGRHWAVFRPCRSFRDQGREFPRTAPSSGCA